MKNILITGTDSYIGTSVEAWLMRNPTDYHVDSIDMKDKDWKEHNFSDYDVVYHVAGIAHADVGHITDKQRDLYYTVNTLLSLETAKKAKESGVKQFIFMSSMIIYENRARYGKKYIISKDTIPKPSNYYGESKWLADKGLRELSDESFKVVILRPPMIYGRGCKGNYMILEKLAIKLPAFPDIDNMRSMLHIDNLCEFVKLMIDNEEEGIFFPQNGEYSNTSNIVKLIAKAKGKKIFITNALNPMVWIASCIPGKLSQLIKKAFGSAVYDMQMSEYYKGNYRVNNLEESIIQTEKE